MSFKGLPNRRKVSKTEPLRKTNKPVKKDSSERNIKVDVAGLEQREVIRNKASAAHIAVVKEPMPVCSTCGKPITLISEAIREPDNSFSHFDCVINKIKEQYDVRDGETVSYVGQGCFAIVAKDEEGKMYFRERIPYESNETFISMKKYVEDSKE